MEVVVTSLGMISSVGRDVVTSCAAIRAGLARPQPLSYFETLDEATQETGPITGHPIRALTEGFTLVGRWLRLSRGCIADLICQGALPDATHSSFWRLTGLLAITPYHNDDRFLSDAEVESLSTESVRLAYLEPLLESLHLPFDDRNADVLCLGHAGALHAIHQAKYWMESRGLERLIVVAVDSYCEPLTLDWLAGHRRLKTPTNPYGLMPGEAGACFMLESRMSARRRDPPMQFGVSNVAVRVEPDRRGRTPGDALAKCLVESLAGDVIGGAFGGSLVLDLNGENWRSTEWGYARVRLREYLRDDVHLMLPATSVGDTGAASGAVNVCVALRSLARGYAHSDKVLVASTSERGHVGSAFFKRQER